MSRQVSGAIASHVHQDTKSVPTMARSFPAFATSIHAAVEKAQLDVVPNTFRVNPGIHIDLFEFYLNQFDPAVRQYHNCDCCRAFINKYGALVTLDRDGKTRSVLWDETSMGSRNPYRKIASVMRQLVERGAVLDQFFWEGKSDWGTRTSNGWDHLWANPRVASHSNKGHELIASEQRQNRLHLAAALNDFSMDELNRALDMFTSQSLTGGDRFIPWLEFLIEAKSHAQVRGEAYNRKLWFRVALAPAGWCTPRSSIIGALIENFRSGMSIEGIRKAHNLRMDPLKYQRPTAAPTAGNIARAEALFAKAGLAKSLERRMAALDEVLYRADWQPKGTGLRTKPTGGLFGHLMQHERPAAERSLLNSTATRITYARFARDVLPRALEIEAVVPHQGNFSQLTTCIHASAPPILQWDLDEARNPFAWYVYHNGSPASNWGLRAGRVKVVGIVKQPSMWNGGFEHQGRSMVFLLDGAADQRPASLALFPESLRADLHEVRSTIEAYSKNGKLARPPRGTPIAAGIRVDDVNKLEVLVRSAGGLARYIIDRMD